MKKYKFRALSFSAPRPIPYSGGPWLVKPTWSDVEKKAKDAFDRYGPATLCESCYSMTYTVEGVCGKCKKPKEAQ